VRAIHVQSSEREGGIKEKIAKNFIKVYEKQRTNDENLPLSNYRKLRVKEILRTQVNKRSWDAAQTTQCCFLCATKSSSKRMYVSK